MGREDRPDNGDYFEDRFRGDILSQGDLFADAPRTYAGLAEEVVVDGPDGGRRFLSGPLQPGLALLITPSCSMGGGDGAEYSHPVRTLVPIVPLQELVDRDVLTQDQVRTARRYDGLINYMVIPSSAGIGLPESLALLYMPFTVDHQLLMATARRVAQLTLTGAQQLQRKLAWYWSGFQLDRGSFRPPMD